MTTTDITQQSQLYSATRGVVFRHASTGHGHCRLPDHNVVDMAPLAAVRLARLDDSAVTTLQGVLTSWSPTGRGVQHLHSPAPLGEAVQATAGPMHLPNTNRPATTVASRRRPIVCTSRPSQPAPASPRHSPPAGAPR